MAEYIEYLQVGDNGAEMPIRDTEAHEKLALKAPAGYGLGASTGGSWVNDFNNAVLNGWYCNYGESANAPWVYGGMLFVKAYSETYVHQVAVSEYHHGITAERWMIAGVWQPWEWINPPMIPSVEYRTTERHNGSPVYKKMDASGVIWWSVDQSVWYRDAERHGAAHAGYSDNGHDTVIAQGTTNIGTSNIGGSLIWTYRKWASGIAECWINDFDYDGHSISAGESKSNSIGFPFDFIDNNLTQYITVYHPDTPVKLSARFYGKAFNHCLPTVQNFGTTDASGFTVDIHIIGRWK